MRSVMSQINEYDDDDDEITDQTYRHDRNYIAYQATSRVVKKANGFSTGQQGRINHCAGYTMGGPPDQLQNFSHAVLTF